MTNNRTIKILKYSGEIEYFQEDKLVKSLESAGANASTINKIVADIEAWIYPEVTTKKIYERAYALLHQEDESSFRYRLKQAIFEMGPTGYPFEVIIGELYKRKGWQVEVGQVLHGMCVTHEMDVIATKGKMQVLVECKYHKDQGKQVSIQVPLYVRSRVNDIIEKRRTMPEYEGFHFVASVVTNTRLSLDSEKYGGCNDIEMLSWNFPVHDGLKEQIEKYRIYPITILKDMTLREKQMLMNQKIVLCSQLNDQPHLLAELGLSSKKQKAVLRELQQILVQPL